MKMADIVVPAAVTLPAGAVVTGYAVSRERPIAALIYPVVPVALSRIYQGFGKLRAETGAAPRKGFGTLIGCAEISDIERNRGMNLWLRLED